MKRFRGRFRRLRHAIGGLEVAENRGGGLWIAALERGDFRAGYCRSIAIEQPGAPVMAAGDGAGDGVWREA